MTIDLHHKKMEKSGIPDFFPKKKLTHRLRALQPVLFHHPQLQSESFCICLSFFLQNNTTNSAKNQAV